VQPEALAPMRPLSDTRKRLMTAARRLCGQQRSFTAAQAADAAGIDVTKARQVLGDMLRAGNVQRVGTLRVPGVCRPVNLYALPRRRTTAQAAGHVGMALERAFRAFVFGVGVSPGGAHA
jgi:predicted ArsR family transcriptional regulator